MTRLFIAVGIAILMAITILFIQRATNQNKSHSLHKKNSDTQQVFSVKGIIREIEPDGMTAKIKHEAIPGYMEAMTMLFDVKNSNELHGLKAGDIVSFQLVVTADDGWMEKVQKIGFAPSLTNETVRVSREVEELNEGDRLGEYTFTNQLGQSVKLHEQRGKALVLSFFYTRCPYPDFCPRTSKSLAETASKLETRLGQNTNWHIYSLSFDPDHDSTKVLSNYARIYNANPQRWSFLTGALEEIDAITEQFGMLIARNGNQFDHNLRTVIIDESGKIHKIFVGNKWTADELTAAVLNLLQKMAK